MGSALFQGRFQDLRRLLIAQKAQSAHVAAGGGRDRFICRKDIDTDLIVHRAFADAALQFVAADAFSDIFPGRNDLIRFVLDIEIIQEKRLEEKGQTDDQQRRGRQDQDQLGAETNCLFQNGTPHLSGSLCISRNHRAPCAAA